MSGLYQSGTYQPTCSKRLLEFENSNCAFRFYDFATVAFLENHDRRWPAVA